MVLAYFDGPRITDDVRDAVPNHARLRRSDRQEVEVEDQATKVLIGPPDPKAKGRDDVPTVRERWARIKAEYEAAAQDPDVDFNGEVEVAEALDPLGGAKNVLADVVGTRQANALTEAGYGSLQAAKALPKEDLVAIDGVGEGTYETLQDA